LPDHGNYLFNTHLRANSQSTGGQATCKVHTKEEQVQVLSETLIGKDGFELLCWLDELQ